MIPTFFILIKILDIHAVNTELVKVHRWFKTNKLSLNVGILITFYYNLFHKPSTKDDIPL